MRLVVASIQVVARHRDAIITHYDTIGVLARNDLEDDAFAQFCSDLVLPAQYELDEAFHHI